MNISLYLGLCMYMSLCVGVCICMCGCMFVHVLACVTVYAYLCICRHMYTYMTVTVWYIPTCLHTWLCVAGYMYVHVCPWGSQKSTSGIIAQVPDTSDCSFWSTIWYTCMIYFDHIHPLLFTILSHLCRYPSFHLYAFLVTYPSLDWSFSHP